MLAALVSLVFAVNQNAPVVVDGELCHPRNLMVKYQNAAALQSLRLRTKVIRVMPDIHYAVVQSQPGMLKQARKQMATWTGVQRVDLDRCALPAYDPNDPVWPDQWDMKAIRTNYAWDTQRGDPNVVVAVIDTGVFVGHPDLAPNIWVNAGEIPDNGIDDDGDGYVDDVNGYDFSHNDGNPDDQFGHGTACSGIVAAAQDNSIGVSGVAPYCRIMALKAATDDGYFYDSNNVAAYLYAADHGAKVLSMSFFSDRVSQSERDAIEYCWSHGVLPVAAAGNAASIYPYYPGGYEHVLSVAAVDGNLNKAGFSNYGSWVDVSAPGVGVNTTTNDGNYTSGFAGTSAACPHVAGVAALCFSANPGATNEQVLEAIEDTATLQSQAPFGEFSNYGLVNAEAAVLCMNGGQTTAHPPVVRYVTRHAQNARLHGPSLNVVTRVYGRGFGDSNSLSLTASGMPVPIVANGRDWFDFNSVSAPFGFDISVNGTPVASIAFPPSTTTSYMLAEASTQSATLTGGFAEALAADGQYIACTRRSDGSILVQATFRKISPSATMKLVLRRQYAGTTAGTENVQLYDWSSASYPYGNFVSLGSGPCPTSMTTSIFTVPNATRFVDPEGTAYLLITTSGDLDDGAELHIDMAHLDQQ
ncbi:MAG TPA: S8 family serine peptidase [Fimbriimonadaceae bacterium]|nr:S8 family serine peptidase [Fimbriimonadaceae bacterium]